MEVGTWNKQGEGTFLRKSINEEGGNVRGGWNCFQ